jgi:raffinose/stachyose/melibiose transport system substrate-binding protein
MPSRRIGQAWLYGSRSGGSLIARVGVAVLAAAVFVLGLGAGPARPAHRGQVTLSWTAPAIAQPALSVLIPNFDRAYPNVTVNVTYAATAAIEYELETTELAAGNGADLLTVWPGCGTPISVCELAKGGYLEAMVDKPWTKRSIPLVTSASKYGHGLFVLSPGVSMFGLFTNDSLLKKLGLQVPQTFSQLVAVCEKARADGVVPVLLPAEGSLVIQQLVSDVALTTVYARDPHWLAELKAGKASFDGTPGWHAALQELVEMSNAGCLEPGAAATTMAAADAMFAQGQALMMVNITTNKGLIDAGGPQFSYSQHPFPSASAPGSTVVLLNLSSGPAVNVRSSPENQAAAQEFVDFLARPKQDALYAQTTGGISQYQFLKGQIPPYLSSFAPFFANHEYAINPVQTWWNADVGNALTTYGTGLLTGQESIDDVLNAMDAAWKQGPS